MAKRWGVSICLAALCVGSSACVTEYGGNVPSNDCKSVSNDPTPGLMGQAEFVWEQGIFSCLFGCTADNPLIVGGRASLAVLDSGGLEAFTAQSSDPGILEVEPSGAFLSVEGVAAGEAEVQLVSTDTGEVIDALLVRVREPYEVLTYDDLKVYYESEAVLTPEIYDDEGCRMVGTGALQYALGGGLGSEHLDLQATTEQELNSSFEQVFVTSGTTGSGSLVVSAPGFEDQLPLAVVGPDSVGSIDMDDEHIVGVGTLTFFYPQISDAAGDAILGVECDWTLDPENSPIQVEPEPGSISVTSDVVAEATLTCTVGSTSASIHLVFE
jgi:hypothetical protein